MNNPRATEPTRVAVAPQPVAPVHRTLANERTLRKEHEPEDDIDIIVTGELMPQGNEHA